MNDSPFKAIQDAQETAREGWMPEIKMAIGVPLESDYDYTLRLKKGCTELSFALSKIDYMCGPPNEMECSSYCVHQNEDAVVEVVKSTLAAKDAEIDRLKKELGDWKLEAEQANEYILKIGRLLGCTSGDYTPEQRIADMVPVEDVRPLVDAMSVYIQNGDIPGIAEHAEKDLSTFTAKYPALTSQRQ